MSHTPVPSSSYSKAARFTVYVATVLSIVMVLFPPFTSLNGTEYAIILTGPEWSRAVGDLGDSLGLTARINWAILAMQLAVVWLIVLGVRHYLLKEPTTPPVTSLVLGSLLFLFTPSLAVGQSAAPEGAAEEATVGVQGGRFGVGFTSSWPAYGLSGTMQVSESLTAEAVLGMLGTVSNFGGRLWYRFSRNPAYDLYGYGAASMYRYGYNLGALGRGSENVLGFGGGAGVEASLRTLFGDENFPPIFVNVEAGLAFANFEYYNFSSFTLGAGIHYRFGGK